MTNGPPTNAEEMLVTINEVYQQTIDEATPDTMKEELSPEELAEATPKDGSDDEINIAATSGGRSGKVKKKVMHELIGTDLWALGKDQWGKRDVVGVRREGCHRRAKKSRVRACILNSIEETKSVLETAVTGKDIDSPLSSQRWVRSHTTNLNMTW